MIGTSPSAYAPIRVKCIHRWRLASSWRLVPSSAAAGRVRVVAMDPPLFVRSAALDNGICPAQAAQRRFRSSPMRPPVPMVQILPAGGRHPLLAPCDLLSFHRLALL